MTTKEKEFEQSMHRIQPSFASSRKRINADICPEHGVSVSLVPIEYDGVLELQCVECIQQGLEDRNCELIEQMLF